MTTIQVLNVDQHAKLRSWYQQEKERVTVQIREHETRCNEVHAQYPAWPARALEIREQLEAHLIRLNDNIQLLANRV